MTYFDRILCCENSDEIVNILPKSIGCIDCYGAKSCTGNYLEFLKKEYVRTPEDIKEHFEKYELPAYPNGDFKLTLYERMVRCKSADEMSKVMTSYICYDILEKDQILDYFNAKFDRHMTDDNFSHIDEYGNTYICTEEELKEVHALSDTYQWCTKEYDNALEKLLKSFHDRYKENNKGEVCEKK